MATSNHTPDTPLKRCTRCGEEKPATREYFPKGKPPKFSDGFLNHCKACQNEIAYLYKTTGSAKRQSVLPALPDGYKQCNICGRALPADREHFFVHKRSTLGFAPACKECMGHPFRSTVVFTPPAPQEGYKYCNSGDNCIHPEGALLPATEEYFRYRNRKRGVFHAPCIHCQREAEKGYRATPQSKENYQAWVRGNHDRVIAIHRKHRENNPELRKSPQARLASKIHYQRRRARKVNLPDTFTEQDWKRAIHYFDNRCAACGKRVSEGEVLHADHWVPLSSADCPGTTSTNILPLCQSCNQSKWRIAPLDWLVRRFGEVSANEILGRIETYFARVKEQSES